MTENTIPYTEWIEENMPELSDEIDIHLRSLMDEMAKEFTILLHGDDRGAIAYEAVAKWVCQSMIKTPKVGGID
tara:strand:+ start:298 stop:519 length:222 start_codon:yes stop_codon:yes gene_type:complete